MNNESGLSYVRNLMEWKGNGNFTLNTIRSILAELGNPQDSIRTIHVTGTNGKGSTSAAVASILGAAGYRVGLNISPHLRSMNERIVLDGKAVDDSLIEEFGGRLRDVCHKLRVRPTMHEGLTALAFLIFAEMCVDWAVIEVGLGGRLDSSNVIRRPEVAIITTIAYDHEHILGHTLEEIAAEKAGIVKPGTKVVTGQMPDVAWHVIRDKTEESGARLYSYERDFCVASSGSPRYTDTDGDEFELAPSLKGSHQHSNMAAAVKAARLLGVSIEDCQRGVSQVFWPGRMETVEIGRRRVVLDCAHNEQGVRALLDYLKSSETGPLSVVFGVLDTKNWQRMVDLLRESFDEWKLLMPASGRAVASSEIAGYLSGFGIRAQDFRDDYESLVRTLTDDKSSKTTVITGSMYMLGTIRHMLVGEEPRIWHRRVGGRK